MIMPGLPTSGKAFVFLSSGGLLPPYRPTGQTSQVTYLSASEGTYHKKV